MVEPVKPEHSIHPHHRPPLTRRQFLAQVVVSAVILVSGIAIGGAGTVLALKDRIMPVFPSSSGEIRQYTPDANEITRRTQDIAQRIQTDYGLTDEQTQRVRNALKDQVATTQQLWTKFHAEEQRIREKLTQTMKGIMTPEQFEKWDSDVKKMVERMRSMRPFEPGRDDRRGPPRGKGDWSRGGPMRDPNNPRADWGRGGPMRDPNDPRRNWGRGGPRDPNAPRGEGPADLFMGPDGPPPGPRMGDPNGFGRDVPPDGLRDFEGGPPPEPDPNGRPDGPGGQE